MNARTGASGQLLLPLLIIAMMLTLSGMVPAAGAGDELRRSEASFNEPPAADISDAALWVSEQVEGPVWLQHFSRTLYSDDGIWSVALPGADGEISSVILSARGQKPSDPPSLHHLDLPGVKDVFFTADSRYLVAVSKGWIDLYGLYPDRSFRKLQGNSVSSLVEIRVVPGRSSARMLIQQITPGSVSLGRMCDARESGLQCKDLNWVVDGRKFAGLATVESGPYLGCYVSGRELTCRHRLSVQDWSGQIVLPPEELHTALAVRNTAPSRWLDGYPSHIFALSSRNRDTASLVEIDLSDLRETVIASMPDQNITKIMYRQVSNQVRPVLALPTLVSSQPVMLDPWLKSAWQSFVAEQEVKPVRVGASGWSTAGRFLELRVIRTDGSAVRLKFDLQRQSLQRTDYPVKSDVSRCLPRAETVPARDGLALPVLIQRPQTAAGAAPTFLYVHGGPFLHDDGSPNVMMGLLCAAGYNVISVNFRGSTGFGQKLYEAGINRMNTLAPLDVADVGRWAIASGIAAAGELHLIGGSYGGYAVLNIASRYPRTFATVTSVNGVTDMGEIVRKFALAETALGAWRRFFNNGQLAAHDNTTYFMLVDRARKITVPTLLIAGSADEVVPVHHSRKMANALQRAGKQVAYIEFAEMEHDLSAAQILEAVRRILGFVANHQS